MSKLRVFVTGIDHSGTSAVAGMLHHLGVMMVEPGAKETRSACGRYALFEQLDIQEANQALQVEETGRWKDIIRRRADWTVWGAKDPRLLYVFGKLVKILDAPHRLILTARRKDDVENSWRRAGHYSPQEIEQKAAAFSFCQGYDHLLVEYEKLRANPYGIAIWLDTELELGAPEVTIKKAARFVEEYRR